MLDEVDWSKQHCGVHQASAQVVRELMPDLAPILDTFPDVESDFCWDVKVHMLMPRQYPCIPDWHCDFVPRVNGIQRVDLCRPDYPLYLWISGPPLTQFSSGYLLAKQWLRYTQLDKHRGTAAADFGWRGLIRATHLKILPMKTEGHLRRHCQVYLDASDYQW